MPAWGLLASSLSRRSRSNRSVSNRTILRIARDTALSRAVKEMYDYTCQGCDTSPPTAAGPYAEAARTLVLETDGENWPWQAL
jgi:predicted restriction endonuclease